MNGLPAYDRRITPARGDLAALHLRGLVQAARFVPGTELEVRDPVAPVRREPSPEAPLDTEALRGERVTVYDDNGEGWCWGQLGADGYVGYLPSNALCPPGADPTHRVAALRTLVFPVRNIKAPPIEGLPLGARLTAEAAAAATPVATSGAAVAGAQAPDEALTRLDSGFFVPTRHLAAIGSTEDDFVAVAERFLGTPYLWGGKTSLGIDCSGLVQTALTACGVTCPRDSDMQERALGTPLATDSPTAYRRGDLIFWTGHVAIVRDDDTIVHANGHHMAVSIERTRDALRRIAAAGSELISVKRLN